MIPNTVVTLHGIVRLTDETRAKVEDVGELLRDVCAVAEIFSRYGKQLEVF